MSIWMFVTFCIQGFIGMHILGSLHLLWWLQLDTHSRDKPSNGTIVYRYAVINNCSITDSYTVGQYTAVAWIKYIEWYCEHSHCYVVFSTVLYIGCNEIHCRGVMNFIMLTLASTCSRHAAGHVQSKCFVVHMFTMLLWTFTVACYMYTVNILLWYYYPARMLKG